MNYKNIVNRNLVNLENCEDEPIHIPGLIQPHGFLIAIDAKTHIISVCSENVIEFVDETYTQLLGKSIDIIFDSEFVDRIHQFQSTNTDKVGHFNLKFRDTIVAFSLHNSDNFIVIEGEPTDKYLDSQETLYNSTKLLLTCIKDSSSLKELSDAVAIEVKKITGYDRVMVYRFDESYNGEVISESKEDHLEPYLGLHYPHTDIPVQARELYIKNHLRIIGDVNYESVPLYVLNNDSIQTLDLSLSILRSVSPIHIQYLKNMCVGATLTISLLHKGKLWGLITCHHYTEKYLSQELRNTVKLYGHVITSQIDVRLLNEEFKVTDDVNNAVNILISKNLSFDRDSIEKLFKKKHILNVCNAVGVSAMVDNQIYTYGETPTDTDIKILSEALFNLKTDNHYHTNTLSREIKSVSSISDEFPGVNYYYLGYGVDSIIWYRKQTIADINWAGDPSKAIGKDSNGLSPRVSFALFKEVVKDSSNPWLKSEINASFNFNHYFLTHLRSIAINEEKENQKILTDALKQVNAELENLNWISTHDLQEPLRKIRMIASTIQEGDMSNIPDRIQNKISKMSSSAERMQVLIGDILAYSKASSRDQELKPVNLNDVLRDVKHILSDTLNEDHAILTITDLPQINGIKFLLKQLFLNIIYNSLKFKKNTITTEINVRYVPHFKTDQVSSAKFFKIEIQDNGIGFDNDYNTKIFKIFSRLNSRTDYPGSGIGLAICKKIMNTHNGHISAKGVLKEGTTICLYFPKP